MKISLILATLNREELLKKAVISILNQSYQNFEIIIIDQSDKKNDKISLLDNRIKYYHIDRRGLSLARNIGISYATGDIIGLTDDDATYTKDVLERVVKKFEKNKNLYLVSGIIVDPITNEVCLGGMKKNYENITTNNILNTCISSSMFIRKNFFDDHQFDELFGVGTNWGSAEETDIALQILYLAHKGIFSPDIVIKHPRVKKEKIPLDKLKKYSLGFGAMCAKHKYLFKKRYMMKHYYKILFKQLCGILLSILRFNKHMIKYYVISFKYKIYGFRQYKKYYKEKVGNMC